MDGRKDHASLPQGFMQKGEGTALRKAATSGDIETVRRLLVGNPSLSSEEATEHNPYTALELASMCGHVEIVRSLLASASFTALDASNHNAFLLSLACEHYDAAAVLLACPRFPLSKVNQQDPITGMYAVHMAAKAGSIDMLQQILASRRYTGVNAQIGSSFGGVALHCAAFDGHLECVELLHESPFYTASVEERNTLGFTPLHSAAVNGHLAVVRFLCEIAGADVFAKDYRDLEPRALVGLKPELGPQSEVYKYLLACERAAKTHAE
eukprot:UN0804